MISETYMTSEEYNNPNDTFASFDSLRNRKFHDISVSVVSNKNDILKKQLETSKINVKFSENENIVLGIQNDDNFIKFLMNIKSKATIIAIIFVVDNNIKCLIKSKEAHPILFINFPVDNDKFYVKNTSSSSLSSSCCYAFPIEKMTLKMNISQLINNGYSFYYTLEGRNLQLHFKSKRDYFNMPITTERNFTFINRCLRPSTDGIIEAHSTKDDEENLSRLDNVNILILANIKNNESYLNDSTTKNDNEVRFEINSLEMILTSITDSGTSVKRVVDKMNSMVWKIYNNGIYNVSKRVMLLKTNANSKIHSGSFSYLIFGIFNTNYYVFIKLITTEKINITDTSQLINLKRFITDKYAIFQMYYCSKVSDSSEFPIEKINDSE